MKPTKLILIVVVTGLLSACQMPSRSGGGMTPPVPSTPSGSPPSAPSGSPPSTPSAEPPASPGGSPPTAGGSEGEPGEQPPAGETGSAGAEEPSTAGEVPEEAGGGVETLDEQLDESLGDFDESVMAEGVGSSDEAVDILDPLSNSNAGADSEEPLFKEGDLSEAGASVENSEIAQRAEEGGSGGGSGPDAEGEPAGGVGGGQDGDDSGEIIPIPDDVGDGRDDDIVLRQIRDAATKERDATLREKLWDEYRRIKGQ